MKKFTFVLAAVFIYANMLSAQTKTVQTFAKDGVTYQSYNFNGWNVIMSLAIQKEYGKYYVARISIENQTGKPFNFFPSSNIKSTFVIKDKEKDGIILSNDEYMKIVNRRQKWNTLLYAYNESNAAQSAGTNYSSSNTNINSGGASYGTANATVSGNGNIYYGTGTSQSVNNSSTNINSNSTSYNGAIAYAAQQNARNNVSNYQNQQNQVKNILNQGYLKSNTIEDQQEIRGQINIRYQKADKLTITISLGGEDFPFVWNTSN